MDLIVKPLRPDLLEDFLNFFDNIAFSDNPEWGVCYCQFYHFAGNIEHWKKATKEQNRNAAKTLITEENMNGFLAFIDNEPVGWCNVNSKDVYEKIPINSESEDNLEGSLASIVCFLIAPAQRKKGIARKLLKHAIKRLKEAGFDWIEVYPRKGDLSDAHSYHGPESLFDSEGFIVVEEDEHFLLMRKRLG
ncbi:MAG: GNAT family N-acetyltransferase [Candidatus Lokiarchaeota archaeon]|nr:GNAT family N-acetyltransferase [Candidatus Lokiarchaeota archaeon]